MKIILDGNEEAMSCEDTDNLAGIIGEISVFRQAFGESDGLFDSVNNHELPVPQLADNHVKTV